ncbi:MAG: nucleotidyltransferase domain-containing protein [Deltaproteobacteria bacterium]|nr:MAG: nucleotidyltransferase domain-containing protein [Deltaproteobacteria bacterium]
MPAPRSDPRSKPTESTVADALTAALADASAPDVASAYLFGSIAEHRAHRESDVDIGVLLAWASHPTRAARFDAGIRLAGRLQGALGATVDLVVLNDAPPLLGRHVVAKGRRIHCRDAAADHAYVRDVQIRAADLEPWLRRMRELKLRALRG